MKQSKCRPDEKPCERGRAVPPDAPRRDESARDSRVPDAARQAGRLSIQRDDIQRNDIQRDRTRWILLR